MKEETTLVRISKKLKNQLKRMSGEKDTTIKELVEKAVIEKLKSQKDV